VEADQSEIRRLSIEVKALRINGKKMKRALFRQIPKRSIIGADGEPMGDPIGWINGYPKRALPGCLHILWSAGGKLYRDYLYDPAKCIPESIADALGLGARRPRLSVTIRQDQIACETRDALKKARTSYRKIVTRLDQLYIGV
jgi:hypothetical protein